MSSFHQQRMTHDHRCCPLITLLTPTYLLNCNPAASLHQNHYENINIRINEKKIFTKNFIIIVNVHYGHSYGN